MSDGCLREVAVFIVTKLGTDSDGVVRMCLQSRNLMYRVRPNLIITTVTDTILQLIAIPVCNTQGGPKNNVWRLAL